MAVIDKIPDYFDDLVTALIDEYGDRNVSYSRSYNDSPPSFPHIYFKRLDSSDTLGTLSGDYKGMNNSVEIRAYHNKGTAKMEDFAWFVRRTMTDKIGMRCTYFNQVDNVADSKIFQYIMRFSALETEME